jgi:hypothetical protein
MFSFWSPSNINAQTHLQPCKASRTQQTPPEPPPPLTKTAHHLKKFSPRGGGSRANPLLRTKTKKMGSELSEPASLKVKCAGQIKVKHKASSCKNWQEIERIHDSRKCTKESAISQINESAIQEFKFILFYFNSPMLDVFDTVVISVIVV